MCSERPVTEGPAVQRGARVKPYLRSRLVEQQRAARGPCSSSLRPPASPLPLSYHALHVTRGRLLACGKHVVGKQATEEPRHKLGEGYDVAAVPGCGVGGPRAEGLQQQFSQDINLE